MKKPLLFIPLLSSLATLPLLIASKCKQEETQEQKDEKLTKKYEKEYIDKQRYVFDDFEQFKMRDEYFYLIKNPTFNDVWNDYANRNIKSYALTDKFFEDFNKWYEDFQWKFKIFKRIMNKYAANEIIKYQNPNNGMGPINLYYVKEVKFDFSRKMGSQNYALRMGRSDFSVFLKLFNIPNLNLNASPILPDWTMLTEINLNKTYYSKINITSNYGLIFREELNKIREIFSIPKPYYKNDHFITHPAGKDDFQGEDRIPRIEFYTFRGLRDESADNEILNLRYKTSFDKGWKDIDVDYLKEYGNYDTFKFKSYRVKIVEYDPKKPLYADPSKVDEFVLSEHGL